MTLLVFNRLLIQICTELWRTMSYYLGTELQGVRKSQLRGGVEPSDISERILLECDSVSKVRVNLSLCLTNYALRNEDACGKVRIAPCILDFGTVWRWVVSFRPRPLHTPWKETPVKIEYEVWRAQKLVRMALWLEKSCPHWDLYSNPSAVQLVYTIKSFMVNVILLCTGQLQPEIYLKHV
jgi:hypothetical protein